ncbi:MAG: hypothetical protein PHN51_10395 [Candidatus Nanopelagicales bacterium]|nr:hypothetical protein [Candidatus Nanopelagicales bacterium]
MGVVATIPEAGLSYVLYGDKSDIVAGYLARQLESLPAHHGNPYLDRIRQAVTASYNYVTDTFIRSGIMNQLQSSGTTALDNYFVELTTVAEFQTANPTMQRYIMAHPKVKQLYLEQNIDGYSDSYKNVFGNEVGHWDYNYRRVMNGVVTDTDEHMHYAFYEEDLVPGDRELLPYEQFIMVNTYHNLDFLLSNVKIDFTHQTDPNAKINK